MVWRVEIRVTMPKTCSWSAAALICAASDRPSRCALTRLLRSQQPAPDCVEISKGSGDLQTVQVLGKPAVTDLLEPEHPLDHPDRVLDLRAHARLGAVRGFDLLIDPAAPAVTLIGKVAGSRCHRAHRLLLPAIGLVAPHPSLMPMQQVRQSEC